MNEDLSELCNGCMPHLADCSPEAASRSRSSSNWSMAANFLQLSPQPSSVKFNSVSSSPGLLHSDVLVAGVVKSLTAGPVSSCPRHQLSGAWYQDLESGVSVSTSSRVRVGGDELSSFTLENSYNTNRK